MYYFKFVLINYPLIFINLAFNFGYGLKKVAAYKSFHQK